MRSSRCRTSRERLATLRRAAEAARNAALLARYRYNSGLIDFQSVLQTQVTLLSVEDSVANAQAADWRRSRAAVQGAGRGLAARVRGTRPSPEVHDGPPVASEYRSPR